MVVVVVVAFLFSGFGLQVFVEVGTGRSLMQFLMVTTFG